GAHQPGMKNIPASLVDRFLDRAAVNQGAPVVGGELDVYAGGAQELGGYESLAVHDRLIGGGKHHDLLTLVAGVLYQLLGLGHVALAGQRLRADLAFGRRAAGEERRTRLALLVAAGDGQRIIVLVDDVEQRLAHLRIIEGRKQLVEADHAHRAQRVGVLDPDVLVLGKQRNQVGRQHLPPVDLAGVERGGGGGGVRDVEPFDAVDLDDLAARRP